MMRALALLMALMPAPAGAACRQALALGLDVSGSVDRHEAVLQIEGLARAFEAPDVRAALFQVAGAPVEVMVFEWSGAASQRVILPWTAIDGPGTADGLSRALRESRRYPAQSETAVGAAMLFARDALLGRSGCARLTLDLSGDGRSNSGPAPAAVDMGPVTVNALVVALPEGRGGDPGLQPLQSWFQSEVIRGPDAFVAVALGYEDFEAAMTRKLVRELAVPGLALAPAAQPPATGG